MKEDKRGRGQEAMGEAKGKEGGCGKALAGPLAGRCGVSLDRGGPVCACQGSEQHLPICPCPHFAIFSPLRPRILKKASLCSTTGLPWVSPVSVSVPQFPFLRNEAGNVSFAVLGK